jgi:hypothetical protein
VPGPLVGPLYPLLALAGLLFAVASRRKQTVFLLVGFVVAALVAAWQAKGLAPRVTDWPAGLLVPGAVAWAAAAGLGLAGLAEAVRKLDVRFSLRRAAAAALVLLSAVTGLVVAGHLVRGAWSPMEAVDSPALPATVTRSQARVLWLAGRPDHGVDFAVTGPEGRTLLDPGRPPAKAVDDLGSVVTDIVQARTHRAGSMLRMFGIGYVVVRPGAEADRLVDLVARQQDLDAKPTEQAALFQGPPDATATGWVVAGDEHVGRGTLAEHAPVGHAEEVGDDEHGEGLGVGADELAATVGDERSGRQRVVDHVRPTEPVEGTDRPTRSVGRTPRSRPCCARCA